MKKIAIIGAGGINSWAIQYMREMINIFYPEEMVAVKIFDEDTVEEKNILRNSQNFKAIDVMESKAEVLAAKYNFIAEKKFITAENIGELKGYDDVILGVDNHETRKLVYDFCIREGIYCLDMRAQGTRLSYFVVEPVFDKKKIDETIEKYNKRFFSNPEVMKRHGSCQLERDVENDHIENANKVVAYFGMFAIYLKRWRKEELTTNEFEFVY